MWCVCWNQASGWLRRTWLVPASSSRPTTRPVQSFGFPTDVRILLLGCADDYGRHVEMAEPVPGGRLLFRVPIHYEKKTHGRVWWRWKPWSHFSGLESGRGGVVVPELNCGPQHRTIKFPKVQSKKSRKSEEGLGRRWVCVTEEFSTMGSCYRGVFNGGFALQRNFQRWVCVTEEFSIQSVLWPRYWSADQRGRRTPTLPTPTWCRAVHYYYQACVVGRAPTKRN